MLREELAGQRARLRKRLVTPLEYDLAAVRPGPRPHVHQVIGNGHDIRIVLDHQNCIALVAQLPPESRQATDILRVQPNRGLIQNVQHLGQAVPQVPDHLDPLGLSTGECRGLAAETEVSQANIHHVPQTFDQPGGDLHRDCVLQLFQELDQFARFQVGQVRDIASTDHAAESSLV